MRPVGQCGSRGGLGGLAGVCSSPRAATTVAISEGSGGGLDRETLRRITVKNNAKKRKLFESFIECH